MADNENQVKPIVIDETQNADNTKEDIDKLGLHLSDEQIALLKQFGKKALKEIDVDDLTDALLDKAEELLGIKSKKKTGKKKSSTAKKKTAKKKTSSSSKKPASSTSTAKKPKAKTAKKKTTAKKTKKS